MTAKLVDDITDTHSNQTREVWGQGIANIVTGFFGGRVFAAFPDQSRSAVRTPVERVSRGFAGFVMPQAAELQ